MFFATSGFFVHILTGSIMSLNVYWTVKISNDIHKRLPLLVFGGSFVPTFFYGYLQKSMPYRKQLIILPILKISFFLLFYPIVHYISDDRELLRKILFGSNVILCMTCEGLLTLACSRYYFNFTSSEILVFSIFRGLSSLFPSAFTLVTGTININIEYIFIFHILFNSLVFI